MIEDAPKTVNPAMASKRRSARQLHSHPHVQGMLEQEDRLLKQALDHLARQSANNIRIITREQQVITAKLKLLEQRLAASRQRSLQEMEREERKRERMTTASGTISRSLSPSKSHVPLYQHSHSRGKGFQQDQNSRYFTSFFPQATYQ